LVGPFPLDGAALEGNHVSNAAWPTTGVATGIQIVMHYTWTLIARDFKEGTVGRRMAHSTLAELFSRCGAPDGEGVSDS